MRFNFTVGEAGAEQKYCKRFHGDDDDDDNDQDFDDDDDHDDVVPVDVKDAEPRH